MSKGSLVLVPTPIGNLGDITLRALEVLKSASVVYAEDTRVTRKLFTHFGISTPLSAFHQHNEHQITSRLVEKMLAGDTVVMVSDAGTPGISDPAYLLVRESLRNDLKVECLPGPVALIPALVASGFPCDRFVFEGFLPHKKGRQKRLLAIVQEERTIVFYESPYRLRKLLEELSSIFGPDREACVCRELSKLHETYHRGTVAGLADHFTKNEPKGEIVVVVAGKTYEHTAAEESEE
jgi:16S rRNA (cytidine1402-2'-O)-methyltransferase